jgi:hypothetical protein
MTTQVEDAKGVLQDLETNAFRLVGESQETISRDARIIRGTPAAITAIAAS